MTATRVLDTLAIAEKGVAMSVKMLVPFIGLTIIAGLTLALGRVADHAAPSTLQALHVLNQEMIFPLVVGTAASMLHHFPWCC